MAAEDESLTLIAVGDLAFNGRYHRLLERHGVAYPFGAVMPKWVHSDVRLGNLESPLTSASRVASTKLTLRGSPHAAAALRHAQFDCVSLANNHMMDFGPEGLSETCAKLDEVGIAHVGAGKNLDEATSPVILERKGHRVGILAFCDVEQISPLYAGPQTAGVASLDLDRCIESVRDLRSHVDWLVVQLHWGVEMSQLPSPQQRRVAARLAGSGVDVVLGHHPHVVQPVDVINGVPVAYSLGDFMFSSTYWHGNNGHEQFLACFQLHPLSRETGWMEVRLDRTNDAQFAYRPALLNRNLTVVPDDSVARTRDWNRLLDRLQENEYDKVFSDEQSRATVRDQWRMNGKLPVRRATLKLLQFGCLPGIYVEPDGMDWRRPYCRADA